MTEQQDFEQLVDEMSAAAMLRATDMLRNVDQKHARALGEAVLAVLRRSEPDSDHLLVCLAMVFTSTLHQLTEEQRQEAMRDLIALIQISFNHIDTVKEASNGSEASTSD